jgi:class 3 adenylate cyclase/predicted ATPase
MDFYDILDQVIDLLKQRGRASYRALKRQFALDDAYLEDLKVEIIKVQQLAVDQDGEMLVWTGEAATAQAVSSHPAQITQPPPAQEQPSPQTAPPPDAERRQLTVMFCDLVDSTKLSSQLDPEDWRDVVRAYQQMCTKVIQRYDGHIAQLLGDGLLVYFGYPQAHEDDAQRAVRTGLRMLASMGDLNQGLQQAPGIQLAIRVGIHTGLVVIGDMGGQGRQEQLALGDVPNIAARIQGLAEPNSILLSADTYRLIQGYFECQACGAQALRGVAEPVAVYHVLQESGARGRLDVAVTRGLTPLVGREQEVGLLLERWEQVKAGHGQVVLLSGDAGIGKSRLVQTLKDHVANKPHVGWECRSTEYAQNTALFPLTDLFQRLLQWQPEESPGTKLGKLARALSQYRLPLEESVQLFAPLFLLPLPENRYPLLNLSPQRQRQKTLETMITILQEEAERLPVLFIVEDLHWTDPTTLELLNLVIEQIPTTSMLMLLTCRPTFQPSWPHRSYLSEITVNRLSQPQVEQIVTRMTNGTTFPQEVLQQIIAKTDGVPLFVEELTKAILESGQLTVVDGHYAFLGAVSTLAIPPTLQDSLMARLDRLVTAKAVAQYAAVIGRQFSYELLQALSPADDARLQHELGRLVEAEIVYQRGVLPQATYMFKHALIQDAAYQSLLRSTRQHYHQRIAQVLETQFPETAETQPELLAYHYTEAGLREQAVHYWQRAGQRSIERSANLETISHFTRGLEVLHTLPDTLERAQHELRMQTVLASTYIAVKGMGAQEVEQAYTRAQALCHQVGALPQLIPVLQGLRRLYTARAAYQRVREIGEQLLDLAERLHDPVALVEGHLAMGILLRDLGALTEARTHVEQGIARYNPQQHRSLTFRHGRDPGIIIRYVAAGVLWLLGYPSQALQQSQEAITLAQELGHAYGLAQALCRAADLHLHRREGAAAHARAEATIALATEHGFAQSLACGTIVRGWARVAQGQREPGLTQMRQGLAALQATGTEAYWYQAVLADAQGTGGQAEAGLTLLAEALTTMEKAGVHGSEAELYRLKGDLLLRLAVPDAAQAEACYQQALAIARRQQAKSWELRTAMSLARLWQQQGKRAEAHALLAPVYGWFTEGFDTADLQGAKALLDELGEERV